MTPTDRALIDAYARHSSQRAAGARTSALTPMSGLSPTRAHQRLVWLLSDTEAWEYAPATMRLIQRRARGRRPMGARPAA
ncbi:MAG: DUF3263 domain-containing protein [Phycicoccus sp.]|uniref:DUF3263 domain-containing protein n=1 Tax=Phycicoccus sp. TaxID=1902410 RepID=UPI001DB6DB3C|nr:DUF3263 domain-containing protein [Phycicoccus sp.]MCB0883082.1 DUF3263 domain-containing protein [Thermoleophilia bacterium]MCB1240269.1 DUF3263 domain-containing protein [Tetrasphaera sp.]MCO5304090.1 DUF3263 domain-containing protein [Phycicoccus sp.]HRV57185.1 DUF3263 domain-containing protein [Phycicoccus sp.]